MPLTRFVADALGVVTICLVVVLVLLVYFALYIHFTSAVGSVGKQNVCKCYIVSNLGFAEPCLFLTLIFLLRASLQRSGTLGRKWNMKTAGFVLLYCFPMFILQLVVILVGPQYKKEHNPKLPSYFIKAASSPKSNGDIALCTYPLLSTLFLGLFATVLTVYLFWLGRRILHSVINKGLQKRVYTLIVSISSFFPLRVVLLGLSVLSDPERLVFDAIAFLAFLSLLCCAGSPPGGSMVSSPGRNSTSSGKRGSISFRTMEKDEASGAAFVELSLFNPSQHSTPPGSPRLLGWPMIPSAQGQGS
ncbi:UNVERIFIED_CONTAM: hypothetical protein Slati_3244300 [Sesamum latifolium]|uniref:Uncharacterized protein n=1 Tax=Sesamum latifolium TaxID=2727402 RepID=A0AAW2UY60_9LAMI